jgi:hypothetical protein
MNSNRHVTRTEIVQRLTQSVFGRLLSVLMLLFVVQLFGAQTLAAQDKKVTLHATNVTLSNVLNDLSKQTGYKFFYSDNSTDTNQKVTVNVVDKSLKEVLLQIFEGKSIGFQLKNKQILLFKKQTETQQSINQNENQSFRKLTGKVTDENGQALPGATVMIKGTTKGTITNANGDYSLQRASSNETLVYSFVGMQSREVNVGNQDVINISLSEKAIGLNEVVAIGYGTIRKKDVTGAVSFVTSKAFDSQSTANMGDALEGKIAGVQISRPSGQPQAGYDITIRGISTFYC